MDDRQSEFDAITEKDVFDEARDRLQIAAEAESKNRQDAKYALQFREGMNHWDQKTVTTESAETPELTINLTDALVTRVVNNIKQQKPRGKCHPVGDGADLETADVINGIGRHIEYRSEASVAYDNAADLAATMGWAYWRMISEYVSPDSFDQDIRLLPIFNTFSVYIDPTAVMPSACDMWWALITMKMKRTEYKRKYPKAELLPWTDIGRDESTGDWEDKENIRLAEYFRIRERGQKLFLLRSPDGSEFTRYADQMPAQETLDATGIVQVDTRMSSRRQVEWFQLNGRKVVDRRILPGTFIPIFRCQGNARDIDGEIVRRGMVKSMIDPQRMVDYGEVAKIKRLGLTPQAPWVAAEGQLDGHPEWTDSNREAYTVLTYKPKTVLTDQGEVLLPPPQRQPPAQIEAGFSEFVQGMRTNLMAVAGMPNEPGADTNATVVSGRAIERRQFLSDQSHFQYYDNLTLGIAHTWRVMLEWIPVVYSEARMQRIIGEDGVPKMIGINQPQTDAQTGISKVKNDLSVGRYDVVMDTGPGYETKREEGADTMIDLLKTPLGEIVAKNGADLIFRSLDHPYMQELADRLAAQNPEQLKSLMEDLPDNAKAIVQQLSQQNQALQRALQEAQIEIKYGLQKEHMKAVVKAHDTETRAETQSNDAILKSKTSIAIEEIRGGIAMANDMNNNRHEAAMLIKKGEQDARTANSSGQ